MTSTKRVMMRVKETDDNKKLLNLDKLDEILKDI